MTQNQNQNRTLKTITDNSYFIKQINDMLYVFLPQELVDKIIKYVLYQGNFQAKLILKEIKFTSDMISANLFTDRTAVKFTEATKKFLKQHDSFNRKYYEKENKEDFKLDLQIYNSTKKIIKNKLISDYGSSPVINDVMYQIQYKDQKGKSGKLCKELDRLKNKTNLFMPYNMNKHKVNHNLGKTFFNNMLAYHEIPKKMKDRKMRVGTKTCGWKKEHLCRHLEWNDSYFKKSWKTEDLLKIYMKL